MSKNLFETYEVNGRQYTDNLPKNALISIPKKQYIEYEQQREEIERLNNIIKKLERLVDDYAWNNYYIKCGNRYLKSEILNDIREIIELKGSDKE